MNQLIRRLVFKKITADRKNNIIEKEISKLGYQSIYSSEYLARLLFSQNDNYLFDYKINRSRFHVYDEKDFKFINVIFIEWWYNQLIYFEKEFKYLNECASFFKKYIIDNNLETELDYIQIARELKRIDDLIDYCFNNNIKKTSYCIYLFFYEEKSNLAIFFEQYINNYIKSNFEIDFIFNILNLKDLIYQINDKEILDRLEYYDLFKSDITYEKIFNSIINNTQITVEDIINKYSISERTAKYIYHEYEIYHNSELQNKEIIKLVKAHLYDNNLDIIDESYIRYYFLYSSQKLSEKISKVLKYNIFYEALKLLLNNYYDIDLKSLHNPKDKIKFISFVNYLDQIKNMDYSDENIQEEIIKKFVSKINIKNEMICVSLYPLSHFVK